MVDNNSAESFFIAAGKKITTCINKHIPLTFARYLSILHEKGKKDLECAPFYLKPDWDKVEKNFFDLVYCQKGSYKALFNELRMACNKMVYSIEIREKNVREEIIDYLSAYFNLMSALFEDNIVFQEEVFSSSLCAQLLSGYSKNLYNESKTLYGFYSPLIMEKILMIYDFTLRFAEDLQNLPEQKYEVINKVFCDLYEEKVSKLFYENVIIQQTPCVCTQNNQLFPVIYQRKNLSSIVPIKPIRWIDKIRAYIEKESVEYTNQTIKILAIGYVRLDGISENRLISKELDELAYVLSERYREKNIHFDFHIIVNKKDFWYNSFFKKKHNSHKIACYDNFVTFHIQRRDYQKVFRVSQICEYLKGNDIILFLDNPNLYENDLDIERGYIGFPVSSTYAKYYEQLDKTDCILTKKSSDAPIHHLISRINIIGIDRKEQASVFHYRLNTPFMNFLKDELKEIEKRQPENAKREIDVHLLYSSTNSVTNSSYALGDNAREEQYDGKEFRLISFYANNNTKPSFMEKSKNDKKSFVVFPLWSMLKNIDIHLLERNEKLRENLKPNIDEKSLSWKLMNVFIKLGWSSNFHEFQYWIDIRKKAQDLDKSYVRKMTEELLTAVLHHNQSAIGKCILQAFYNTIYSRICTIDDVVFYCLFRNRRWEVIQPQIIDMGNFISEEKERKFFSINQPNRWTLVRAINTLQQPALLSDQYYTVAYELKNNGYTISKLLYDIREVCEEQGYTKCRLYDNVKSLIKGG